MTKKISKSSYCVVVAKQNKRTKIDAPPPPTIAATEISGAQVCTCRCKLV